MTTDPDYIKAGVKEAFFRKNVVNGRENDAKGIKRGVTMTCDIQSRATSFIMQPPTYKAKACSAASEKSPLASTTVPRRDPTERDVQIEILFCGICHSDLHSVRNEWSEFMATNYPIVPGHEIVGRVTKAGSAVAKYTPGDLVAVGCTVDSDLTCPNCKRDLEQFCPNMTLTFNSPDKHLRGVTYGGYSDSVVVDEHFVLRLPSNLNIAGVPILYRHGFAEIGLIAGFWVN